MVEIIIIIIMLLRDSRGRQLKRTNKNRRQAFSQRSVEEGTTLDSDSIIDRFAKVE